MNESQNLVTDLLGETVYFDSGVVQKAGVIRLIYVDRNNDCCAFVQHTDGKLEDIPLDNLSLNRIN